MSQTLLLKIGLMYYLTVLDVRSQSVPKTMCVKDLAECLFVFYTKQMKTCFFFIILRIIKYNIYLLKMVFINRYMHFLKWFRLLDRSHSDWRGMVPWNSGFDLHFSDNEWCWASFHVFVSHLYVFFGEMSI